MLRTAGRDRIFWEAQKTGSIKEEEMARLAGSNPSNGKGTSVRGNGRVSSRKNRFDELVYAGPGTPMGTYLRSFWQPVAVAKDLMPGTAMPIRIMNENLTLFRGESGKPFIVADVCAHRRTRLDTGWVEGDCIRCRYHGWKFDGTGQCVEMPAEDPSFPPKVKILHYPAAEYASLIFAYMGEGSPPPMPRRTELDRDYGVQWASSHVWPCNWFQRIENSLDAVHVSFVHRDSRFGKNVSYDVPDLTFEETEWGIRMISQRSTNRRVNEFLFPNCNHIVVPTQLPNQAAGKVLPWTDLFNWFVPVDDWHTEFFTARSAPITGKAAEEFEAFLSTAKRYNPHDDAEKLFHGIMPDDTVGDTATSLVNAQDYVVQVGQGTIVDRSKERLGRSDEGVILLRKIFHRELGLMKKGQSTKVWQPREGYARLPVPSHVPAPPDPYYTKTP